MTNGKNSNKDFFTVTGAMPATGMGNKVVSEVIKATGIKKHAMRTAKTIMAPLALLTLCMLPSIVKALSVVSGIASIAVVAFVAYRLFGTKGQVSETTGALHKSRRTITPEELEARKARAWSFGGRAQADEMPATKTMTVN